MKTDLELQLELGKFLNEQIISTPQGVFWCTPRGGLLRQVNDYEWLHVCHLIEFEFDKWEGDKFANYLGKYVEHGHADFGSMLIVATTKVVSASWQQRARAILKVKGLEP